MANDLVEKNQAVALDLEQLEKGLDRIGEIVSQIETRQGPPMLRFTREGIWVVGSINEPVAEGTTALVHLDKLSAGYIAWKAGRPIGEEMRYLLFEDPVDPTTLPPVDAPRGWEPQISIGMTLLDDNLEVEFKSNRVGGRQAFASLLKAIYQRRLEAPQEIIPVVSLAKGQYTHPDHGVVYVPRFVVVDWKRVPEILSEETADDDGVPF